MKRQSLFGIVALVCVMMLAIPSCNKDMKDDIKALQEKVNALQQDINALKAAMITGKVVKDVTYNSTSNVLTVSYTEGANTTLNLVTPTPPTPPKYPVITDNGDNTVTIKFWDGTKDQTFTFPYIPEGGGGTAKLQGLTYPTKYGRFNIGTIFNFNATATGAANAINWKKADGTAGDVAIAAGTAYVSDYSDFTIPVTVSPVNANLSGLTFQLVDPKGKEIPNAGITLTKGYNGDDHLWASGSWSQDDFFGMTRAAATGLYTATIKITGAQRAQMFPTINSVVTNIVDGDYYSLQAVDGAGALAATEFGYNFYADNEYDARGRVAASTTTPDTLFVCVGETFDLFNEIYEQGFFISAQGRRANFAKLGQVKIIGMGNYRPIPVTLLTTSTAINTATTYAPISADLVVATKNDNATRTALIGKLVKYQFQGIPMGAAAGVTDTRVYDVVVVFTAPKLPDVTLAAINHELIEAVTTGTTAWPRVQNKFADLAPIWNNFTTNGIPLDGVTITVNNAANDTDNGIRKNTTGTTWIRLGSGAVTTTAANFLPNATYADNFAEKNSYTNAEWATFNTADDAKKNFYWFAFNPNGSAGATPGTYQVRFTVSYPDGAGGTLSFTATCPVTLTNPNVADILAKYRHRTELFSWTGNDVNIYGNQGVTMNWATLAQDLNELYWDVEANAVPSLIFKPTNTSGTYPAYPAALTADKTFTFTSAKSMLVGYKKSNNTSATGLFNPDATPAQTLWTNGWQYNVGINLFGNVNNFVELEKIKVYSRSSIVDGELVRNGGKTLADPINLYMAGYQSGSTALDTVALYKHFDFLNQSKIRIDIDGVAPGAYPANNPIVPVTTQANLDLVPVSVAKLNAAQYSAAGTYFIAQGPAAAAMKFIINTTAATAHLNRYFISFDASKLTGTVADGTVIDVDVYIVDDYIAAVNTAYPGANLAFKQTIKITLKTGFRVN